MACFQIWLICWVDGRQRKTTRQLKPSAVAIEAKESTQLDDELSEHTQAARRSLYTDKLGPVQGDEELPCALSFAFFISSVPLIGSSCRALSIAGLKGRQERSNEVDW